jgi:hypothetical protein
MNKLNVKHTATLAAIALGLIATAAQAKTPVVNTGITEAEVLAAQKAWGEALVSISSTFDRSGQAAAKALAEKVIDAAYGYQYGAVLFKPTLTTAPPDLPHHARRCIGLFRWR